MYSSLALLEKKDFLSQIRYAQKSHRIREKKLRADLPEQFHRHLLEKSTTLELSFLVLVKASKGRNSWKSVDSRLLFFAVWARTGFNCVSVRGL